MAHIINTFIKEILSQCRLDNWKITLMEQWEGIVGNLSTHVFLDKIEEETITLTVNDSCWLQELYMLSPILLQKINATLDQNRIKHIRFKLAEHKKKRPSLYKTSLSSPYTIEHHALDSREKNALSCIEDSELQGSLERFYMHCKKEYHNGGDSKKKNKSV